MGRKVSSVCDELGGYLVSGVCGELGGYLVVVWWDGSLGGYLVWWNGRVSSGIGGYLSGRISSYILNRK